MRNTSFSKYLVNRYCIVELYHRSRRKRKEFLCPSDTPGLHSMRGVPRPTRREATAEGGSRTLTPSRARDFESRASANSATSALLLRLLNIRRPLSSPSPPFYLPRRMRPSPTVSVLYRPREDMVVPEAIYSPTECAKRCSPAPLKAQTK